MAFDFIQPNNDLEDLPLDMPEQQSSTQPDDLEDLPLDFSSSVKKLQTDFQTKFGRPFRITTPPGASGKKGVHKRLYNGQAADIGGNDLSDDEVSWLTTQAPQFGIDAKDYRKNWKDIGGSGPHIHMNIQMNAVMPQIEAAPAVIPVPSQSDTGQTKSQSIYEPQPSDSDLEDLPLNDSQPSPGLKNAVSGKAPLRMYSRGELQKQGMSLNKQFADLSLQKPNVEGLTNQGKALEQALSALSEKRQSIEKIQADAQSGTLINPDEYRRLVNEYTQEATDLQSRIDAHKSDSAALQQSLAAYNKQLTTLQDQAAEHARSVNAYNQSVKKQQKRQTSVQVQPSRIDVLQSSINQLDKELNNLQGIRRKLMDAYHVEVGDPTLAPIEDAMYQRTREIGSLTKEVGQLKAGTAQTPSDIKKHLSDIETRRSEALHQAVAAPNEDEQQRLYNIANQENDRAQMLRQYLNIEERGQIAHPALKDYGTSSLPLSPKELPWYLKGTAANISHAFWSTIDSMGRVGEGFESGLGIKPNETRSKNLDIIENSLADIAQRGGSGLSANLERAVFKAAMQYPLFVGIGRIGSVLGVPGETAAFGLWGAAEAAGHPETSLTDIGKSFLTSAVMVPIYRGAGLIPNMPVRVAVAGGASAILPAIEHQDLSDVLSSALIGAALSVGGKNRRLFSLDPEKPPSYVKPVLDEMSDYLTKKYGMTDEQANSYVKQAWAEHVKLAEKENLSPLEIRKRLRQFMKDRENTVRQYQQPTFRTALPPASSDVTTSDPVGPFAAPPAGPAEQVPTPVPSNQMDFVGAGSSVAPDFIERTRSRMARGAPIETGLEDLNTIPRGHTATYRGGEGDIPIQILGVKGTDEYGRVYAQVAGSDTGVPIDQIDWHGEMPEEFKAAIPEPPSLVYRSDNGTPLEVLSQEGEAYRVRNANGRMYLIHQNATFIPEGVSSEGKGTTVLHGQTGDPLTVLGSNRSGYIVKNEQNKIYTIHRNATKPLPVSFERSSIPETPATLNAQMQALTEGRKSAVLITPGESMPEVPRGMLVTKTDIGTFIHPSSITPYEMSNAASMGIYHRLLGLVAPRPVEGAPSVTVVAQDIKGNELQSAVIPPEVARSQQLEFERIYPHAIISIGGENLNKAVLSHRADEIERQGQIVSERPARVTGVEGVVARQKQEQRKLRRELGTDALTGVQSARAFHEAKEHIDRDPNREWVTIDLNNFKSVNDTLGHAVGDERLKSIGQAMLALKESNPSIQAFRSGGDEFSFAVPKGQGESIARQIEDAIKPEALSNNKIYSVSATTDNTYDQADVKLQAAKAERKSALEKIDTPPAETHPAVVESRYAYRTRDIGEQGVPSESHSQATLSREQAEGYIESRGNIQDKPQELVRVDLWKLTPDSYEVAKAPGDTYWIKFKEALPESAVEKILSKETNKPPQEKSPQEVGLQIRTDLREKYGRDLPVADLMQDISSIHDEMQKSNLDAHAQLEAYRTIGFDFKDPVQMTGTVRAVQSEFGQIPLVNVLYKTGGQNLNYRVLGRFPGGEKVLVMSPDSKIKIIQSPFGQTGNTRIKGGATREHFGKVPVVKWQEIGMLSDAWPTKAEIHRVNPGIDNVLDLTDSELQEHFPEVWKRLQEAQDDFGNASGKEMMKIASKEGDGSDPEEVQSRRDAIRDLFNAPNIQLENSAEMLYNTTVVTGYDLLKLHPEKNVWESRMIEKLGDNAKPYLPNVWDAIHNQTPMFFSPLERAIKTDLPAKASADQAKGIIRKSGVSDDEMKWTYFDEFLKERGMKEHLVTRQEALEFFQKNKVQLTEKIFHNLTDDELKNFTRDVKSKILEAGYKFEYGNHTQWKVMFQDTSDFSSRLLAPNEMPESLGYLPQWLDETYKWAESGHGPRFTSHTLPGGTNNREITLAMPNSLSFWEYKSRFKGSGISEDKLLDQYAQSYEPPPSHKYNVREADTNRIALLRVNDRVGPNREKILHVDEYQDDLQNEIQKIKQQIKDLRAKEGQSSYKLGDKLNIASIKDAEKELTRLQNLLPFRGKSHELAMKYALGYAINHGYDMLTWATGTQVSDRYNLSTHIDNLVYSPEVKTLEAFKNGEMVINKSNIDPSSLPDFVGKDVAERLLSAPLSNLGAANFHELKNEQLKISPKGKLHLYDRMIPDFMRKYTKRWNGIVQDVTLPSEAELTLEPDGSYSVKPQDVFTGHTLHGLRFTPQMRDSILRSGQSLFGSSEGQPSAVTDALMQVKDQQARRRRNPSITELESKAYHGSPYHFDKFTLEHEVELSPEADEYLLWDKSLDEQSEKVQKFLQSDVDFKRLMAEPSEYQPEQKIPLAPVTGGELYKILTERFGQPRSFGEGKFRWNASVPDAEAASKYLNSLGIRGIKYLDGTSRSKGEGSYNYVIFDDADVVISEIENKNFSKENIEQAIYDHSSEASEMIDASRVHLGDQMTAGAVSRASRAGRTIHALGKAGDAFFDYRDKSNRLYLNDVSEEILRMLRSEAQGKEKSSVYGVAIDIKSLKNLADTTAKMQKLDLDPKSTAVLKTFSDIFSASLSKTQPLIIADALYPTVRLTVKHEEDHRTDFIIRDMFNGLEPDVNEMESLPHMDLLFERIGDHLGYGFNPREISMEAKARIVTGDINYKYKDKQGIWHEERLLTDEEQKDFLEAYYTLMADTYHEDVLDKFKFMTNKAREVRDEIKERYRQIREAELASASSGSAAEDFSSFQDWRQGEDVGGGVKNQTGEGAGKSTKVIKNFYDQILPSTFSEYGVKMEASPLYEKVDLPEEDASGDIQIPIGTAHTMDVPKKLERQKQLKGRVEDSYGYLEKKLTDGSKGLGHFPIEDTYHISVVTGYEIFKKNLGDTSFLDNEKYYFELDTIQAIWKLDMLKELGERARPHLDAVWDLISGKAPTFYSPVENLIRIKMPNKASVEQIKGILKGVSDDEMKWSGLNDFLSKEKRTITKQELLDHLAVNNLKIETITSGITLPPLEWKLITADNKTRYEARDSLGYKYIIEPRKTGKHGLLIYQPDGLSQSAMVADSLEAAQGFAEGLRFDKKNPEAIVAGEIEQLRDAGFFVDQHPDDPSTVGFMASEDGPAYDEYGGDILSAEDLPTNLIPAASAIADIYSNHPETTGTRYSQYTLEGGKNYVELKMQLPERTEPLGGKWERAFYADIKDSSGNIIEYGWENEHGNAITTTENQNPSKVSIVNQNAQFQSPHWDEPNIIAHIRGDEREHTDGVEGFVIDEAQSDWATKIRKRGVHLTDLPTGYKTERDGIRWRVRNPQGDFVHASFINFPTEKDAIEATLAGLNNFLAPQMPFIKQWPLLTVKQSIRHAVERGLTRVSLIPARVHIKRWGTERAVWSREDGDEFNVTDSRTGEILGTFSDVRLAEAAITRMNPEYKRAAVVEPSPLDGWRFQFKGQEGGIAGGIDLEQEGLARGILSKEVSVIVRNKEDIKNIVFRSAVQDKEQVVEKIWKEMHRQGDNGICWYRAEGLLNRYGDIAEYIQQRFPGRPDLLKFAWDRADGKQSEAFMPIAMRDVGKSWKANVDVNGITDEFNSPTYEIKQRPDGTWDVYNPRGEYFSSSLHFLTRDLALDRLHQTQYEGKNLIPVYSLDIPPQMSNAVIRTGQSLYGTSVDDPSYVLDANMRMSPQGRKNVIDMGIVVGHQILSKENISEFKDWSDEMIRQLGESIRPHLESIWSRLQEDPNLTELQSIRFNKPDATGKSDPFYSPLEEAIDEGMKGRMEASQLKGYLRAQGITDDEIYWTHFGDFLTEKGMKEEKITKQEALDFLKNNRVEIVEATFDEKLSEQTLRDQALKSEDGKRLQQQGWSFTFTRLGDDDPTAHVLFSHKDQPMLDYRVDKVPDKIKSDAQEIFNILDRSPIGAKFGRSDLVLPGGSNYKEITLSLPREHVPASWDSFEQLEAFNRNARLEYKVPSGHAYGVPEADINRLAHIRFNDRTDAEGKKVLFLEEIQSDWHQQGRKTGYRIEGTPDKIKEKIKALGLNPETKALAAIDIINAGGSRDLANAWIQLVDQSYSTGTTDSRVPDAPFSKTWPDLVLRRMIRYAAENGYDKISWTTGSQQADRYDLSKQVDKIIAQPSGTNRFIKNPSLDTIQLTLFQKGTNHPVQTQTIKASELENWIGKEAAVKLLDQLKDGSGQAILEGLDLKTGGEGMKGFYDKILPSVANKIGKKWEAKVGKTWWYEKVEGLSPDEVTGDLEIPKIEVHSLDITPSMKASALREGQPMFGSEPPVLKKIRYLLSKESNITELESKKKDRKGYTLLSEETLPSKYKFEVYDKSTDEVVDWFTSEQVAREQIYGMPEYDVRRATTIPDKIDTSGFRGIQEQEGRIIPFKKRVGELESKKKDNKKRVELAKYIQELFQSIPQAERGKLTNWSKVFKEEDAVKALDAAEDAFANETRGVELESKRTNSPDHIIKMLDNASQIETDKRYNPSVIRRRNEQAQDIRDFVYGESPIAMARSGDYSVSILSNGHIIYTKEGWEPVATGIWQDWPESHWNLTDAQYKALPRNERAELEAKEQLKYKDQFAHDWLSTYHPDVFDQMWWNGGWKELAIKDDDLLDKAIIKYVERNYKPNLSKESDITELERKKSDKDIPDLSALFDELVPSSPETNNPPKLKGKSYSERAEIDGWLYTMEREMQTLQEQGKPIPTSLLKTYHDLKVERDKSASPSVAGGDGSEPPVPPRSRPYYEEYFERNDPDDPEVLWGKDITKFDHLRSRLSNLDFIGTYERRGGDLGREASEIIRDTQVAIGRGVIDRNVAIKDMKRDLQPIIEAFRYGGKPGLADMIEDHVLGIASGRGHRSQIGRTLKKIQYDTKLRFNIKSSVLNMLQPLQTLWPHVSSREFAHLAFQARQPSIRKSILEKVNKEAGAKVEGGIEKRRWLPDLFSKASDTNRIMGYLHGMNEAKRLGLSEDRSERLAADWAKKVEFDNSEWDVIPLFDGDIASVLTQFKGFTVKNIESITNDLKKHKEDTLGGYGARAGKRVLSQLALGGVKSIPGIKTLAGLLVLGALAKVFGVFFEDDEAETLAEAVYYGAPSLIGEDISNSMMILDPPFGDTVYEQLLNFLGGPTISTTASIIEKGGKQDYMGAVKSITPYYRMGESAIDLIKGGATTLPAPGGHDIELNRFETLMRVLGFTPVKQGRFYEGRGVLDLQSNIAASLGLVKTKNDIPSQIEWKLIDKARKQYLDDPPMTSDSIEHVETEKQIINTLRSGRLADDSITDKAREGARKQFSDAVDRGILAPDDESRITKKAMMSYLQYNVSNMPLENALDIFLDSSATKEERASIAAILADKYMRWQNERMEEAKTHKESVPRKVYERILNKLEQAKKLDIVEMAQEKAKAATVK